LAWAGTLAHSFAAGWVNFGMVSTFMIWPCGRNLPWVEHHSRKLLFHRMAWTGWQHWQLLATRTFASSLAEHRPARHIHGCVHIWNPARKRCEISRIHDVPAFFGSIPTCTEGFDSIFFCTKGVTRLIRIDGIISVECSSPPYPRRPNRTVAEPNKSR
jgi:hypothetical protein